MADEMDKFFGLDTPSGQAAVERERDKLGREADDMALALAAYNLGWCEAQEGIRKFDPRVILSWSRKVTQ